MAIDIPSEVLWIILIVVGIAVILGISAFLMFGGGGTVRILETIMGILR